MQRSFYFNRLTTCRSWQFKYLHINSFVLANLPVKTVLQKELKLLLVAVFQLNQISDLD